VLDIEVYHTFLTFILLQPSGPTLLDIGVLPHMREGKVIPLHKYTYIQWRSKKKNGVRGHFFFMNKKIKLIKNIKK
jgi:hypothetical protein